MRRMGVAATMLDASEVLVVTPTSDGQSVDVDYDASNARLDAWAATAASMPEYIVATGFIARNPSGQVLRAAQSWSLSV